MVTRVFDFERFNGFARSRLDDLLFNDLWNHDIFNESDMHSAAYYYIRKYFSDQGRSNIYVRCEPHVGGMKPDIVVFDSGNPVYALEFKFFSRPDHINEEAILSDLEKLDALVGHFDSMKWGFFHVIFDADEHFSISDARLRRAGFSKVSVTTINARRKEESGRRRVGYDEWRTTFDRLQSLHKEHA